MGECQSIEHLMSLDLRLIDPYLADRGIIPVRGTDKWLGIFYLEDGDLNLIRICYGWHRIQEATKFLWNKVVLKIPHIPKSEPGIVQGLMFRVCDVNEFPENHFYRNSRRFVTHYGIGRLEGESNGLDDYLEQMQDLAGTKREDDHMKRHSAIVRALSLDLEKSSAILQFKSDNPPVKTYTEVFLHNGFSRCISTRNHYQKFLESNHSPNNHVAKCDLIYELLDGDYVVVEVKTNSGNSSSRKEGQRTLAISQLYFEHNYGIRPQLAIAYINAAEESVSSRVDYFRYEKKSLTKITKGSWKAFPINICAPQPTL